MKIKNLAFFTLIVILSMFSLGCPHNKCPPHPTIGKVNVFLDNSGSMGGFFHQETQFKTMVYSFVKKLVFPQNFGDKTVFYLISDNTKIIHLDTFGAIISSKASFQGAASPFAKMLDTILSKTDSSTVSILITDGIPSGTKQEIDHYKKQTGLNYNQIQLPAVQTDISGVVSRYNKYAYAFYSYESAFKGTIELTDYPYYFLIMGTPALVAQFEQRMRSDLRDSIKRSYFMFSNAGSNIAKQQCDEVKPKMAFCIPYKAKGASFHNTLILSKNDNYNLAFCLDLTDTDVNLSTQSEQNIRNPSTEVELWIDGTKRNVKTSAFYKVEDILKEPNTYSSLFDMNGKMPDAIRGYTDIIVFDNIDIKYDDWKNEGGTIAIARNHNSKVKQLTSMQEKPKASKTFGIHAFLGGVSEGIHQSNKGVTFKLYCPYSK